MRVLSARRGHVHVVRNRPVDVEGGVVSIYKEPVTDYQRAVEAFKKQFLSDALRAYHGNRTRAAQAIGLQRTYLLRLIRDLKISVPPAARALNRME